MQQRTYQLWAPRIYTPTGFVAENILEGVKALDVGCGQRKLAGAVGLDVLEHSQADIIHDIAEVPWPVESNAFDLVLLNHVLEHVDVLKTLGEVHRILKPTGHVVIQVPYFRSLHAFVDPTHRHFFTSQSLDYFVQGSELSCFGYVPFCYRKLGFWYGLPYPGGNPLKEVAKAFMSRWPRAYDQYFSLLFPVTCLIWELEPAKAPLER